MAEGYWPPNDDLDDRAKKMATHLRTETRRRGKRAEFLPPTADIRAYHRTERAQLIFKLEIGRKLFWVSNLTDKMCSSKTAFDQLERTVIPHLGLEESATGKYVLVRILEEGYEYYGYHTVVEDHEGNVCCLFIYNFPLEELSGSIGCALIIKEPYFKMNVNKHAFLRCNCPTDIIILRPTYPLYNLASEIKWKNTLEVRNALDVLMATPASEDPGQWCKLGDQLLRGNRHVAAREAYRLGLRCCQRSDPNNKILRLKLLKLHFLLEYYEWATIYCNHILNEFPNDRDALYYLGIGYCMQRKFRTARTKLEKLLALFPDDRAAQSTLFKVEARIREEENGTFNFEKIRRMSIEDPFKLIECADYFGPMEIMRISGKGRGWVLTKDVRKGDILLVSKAVVIFFLQKNPDLLIGRSDKEQLDLMSSDNIKRLTRMIYKNPNTIGAQVYDLFTGSHTDGPIQQFCLPEKKQEAICDVEKIRSIYKNNNFLITEAVNGEIKVKGEGLFLYPSYLNHNCSPNVDIQFFNDVMVVKAKSNLKNNTELAFSYVPPYTDFAEKKEILRQRGIMNCLCKICKRRR